MDKHFARLRVGDPVAVLAGVGLLVLLHLSACSPSWLPAPTPTLMQLASLPTAIPITVEPSPTATSTPTLAGSLNVATVSPTPAATLPAPAPAPVTWGAPPAATSLPTSASQAPAINPVYPTAHAVQPITYPTAPAVVPIYPTAPAPGMSAADADLLFAAPVPSAAEILEWRPPPVPVPHSLHPHDHYWLRRPIPSGQVDWGLDWYPYGGNGGGRWRLHHGMDFPNDPGTPVLAAGDGVVIYVDDNWVPRYYVVTPTAVPNQAELGPSQTPTPTLRLMGPYGNYVIIQHDWGWEDQPVFTLYGHLLEIFVQEGDQVTAGDLIGGVGNTGNSTGPHLHFEVRVGRNTYADTRNPALWMAPYEGWGTLAGRLTTARSTFWRNAAITVYPLNADGVYIADEARVLTSYADSPVNPDDNWAENFVVPDLPAGEYLVVAKAGREILRSQVTIRPGATTFIRMHTTSSAVIPLPPPVPSVTPTP